ncbi:MAG: hypothetical protein APR63_01875 [Desulfuromonas sp. SDB]|nr:MAG: hypothetical protein APR63_01875 [Desulfuromonas sp. SDB]
MILIRDLEEKDENRVFSRDDEPAFKPVDPSFSDVRNITTSLLILFYLSYCGENTSVFLPPCLP